MCFVIAYLVVGWAVVGTARTVPGTRPLAGRAPPSARRLGMMTLARWMLPLEKLSIITAFTSYYFSDLLGGGYYERKWLAISSPKGAYPSSKKKRLLIELSIHIKRQHTRKRAPVSVVDYACTYFVEIVD